MLLLEHCKKLLFVFMSIAVLASCGNNDNKAAAAKLPADVTVVTIEPKDVAVSFEYVAQTQSSHLVNIQARVNGFLEKRVYVEGEFVTKGQVLFIMDKKPFQTQVDASRAALERQEASLETAKLNLARVEPLAKLNALSQKDLDDAKGRYLSESASVEQAKAQLETALLNLSYCTIYSPINGITSSAQKQEGTYLNIQDSLLTTVSALSPMWVNFSLSEKQIQKFRDQVIGGELVLPYNDEFEVEVIQVNGKIFPHKGQITFREPYFNPETGTFLIRASVDNPNGVLRSNQYVRARLIGAIRPNAILIPQKAVLQSAKGHYVWVVNSENKADFRPVIVGDWQGTDWFITDGLQAKDRVVVDGGLGLQPGDAINITNSSNSEEKIGF